jgi:DNA-binding transcriptional LysR family regulator
MVEKELAYGSLQEILPETAVSYDPLYLYYPSRRGNSTVFKLVVDALRWRE